MIKISLYILFALSLFSCVMFNQRTPPPLRSSEIKSIPAEKKFFPNITLFHESMDSSIIFISVKSDDLLYVRSEANAEFTAKMKVNYQIFKEGTKIPLDTGTLFLNDEGNIKNKTVVLRKKIKLETGKTYESVFKCSDLNREEKYTIELILNKENENNRQNFLLLKENQVPIFNNVTNEKSIWLAHPKLSSQSLWVRYYNRKFDVPAPPFSDNKLVKFSYQPDSLFEAKLNDSGYVKLNLKEKGFYHFQRDSSKQEGFTLFLFKGEYPRITHVDQLAEPLRYLTSTAEYTKIIESTDVKKSVDNFWLDKCGSKERAREIIKQYYGRAEKANKLYGSFVEGWKTDRGMISIIFGEPYSITKTIDTEIWYYNNERAYSYITFTFIKVKNPFSDNDYILTREPGFKTQWYRAVESWRQGRSFNANNF
jgi:GWxTD domain-containing protein